MSGAESALEGAILERLRGDAGVIEVLGEIPRVFDVAEARPAYPYLQIARHQSEPRDAAEAEASEHRVDIHVVTRMAGRQEAKAGLAAARAALTAAPLEMEGWRCVLLVPVFADLIEVQRAQAFRAHLRVRVLLEPIA